MTFVDFYCVTRLLKILFSFFEYVLAIIFLIVCIYTEIEKLYRQVKNITIKFDTKVIITFYTKDYI